MNITKYLHSCLLVKEAGKSILIDPGQFTYDARILDISSLNKLDFLLITHEHADHFSLPFVKEITATFPDVQIITTASIVTELKREEITATSAGTSEIGIEPVTHEEIYLWPAPENVRFTIFNKLSHPGDSFHFTSTTDILAMPMTAPWGSMVQAIKKVIELKPKMVIPIHDWHWKDEALEGFYPHIANLFKHHDIEFKLAKTGVTIEI
jgi:L-ascorbate metabolism protein UlaG (beta-lactamase superfamily)